MTDQAAERIACAMLELARVIRECSGEHQTNAILNRIRRIEDHIMSAISDFAAKQTAFNDRIDTAVTGLTGDVHALKDEILKLQNSPGSITAEDQALLDAIQARSNSIATKLEALDAETATAPTPPAA